MRQRLQGLQEIQRLARLRRKPAPPLNRMIRQSGITQIRQDGKETAHQFLARPAVAVPRNAEEIRTAVFRGAASANGTAPSARGAASAACRPLPTEPHHPAARSPRNRSFPQNGSRFRRRRLSTGNGIRPFFAHQPPAAHHRFRARRPPAIQSAPRMNRPGRIGFATSFRAAQRWRNYGKRPANFQAALSGILHAGLPGAGRILPAGAPKEPVPGHASS